MSAVRCGHRIEDGSDDGLECGGAVVERLAHLNEHMDWPHDDGTPVCAEHLAEHAAESLLTPSPTTTTREST